MVSSYPWLALLGPLALACAGLARGRAALRLAPLAAVMAFVAAVVTAAAVIRLGPLRTGVLGAGGVGLGVQLDGLSAVMSVLVTFVGAVVVRYSRTYLDGDPGHARFMRWLCLTLAAVLLLIVSGNMLLLILAWAATSLCLNRLLLFYGTRPGAVLGARKKFLASRAGDACLVGAAVLVWRLFGTLDHAAVRAGAEALQAGASQAGGAIPGSAHAAAALLVAAALLKSAQAPWHGWLTEVMETPTPVSALLHAGVINAGGFLLLRFADLVGLSAPSLDALAIVGGATALFGSVVMLAQTSVKVSLAYSTIAQMGFMMLQCGLGAFPAALLHIVAHSLYKAHAFLSSGSVIDLARASWSPSPGGRPHPARMVAAVVAVLGVALAAGTLAGASPARQPGVFALGAIMLLGLVHLVASAVDERPSVYVIGRTVAAAAAVAAAYFALQAGAGWLMAGTLPPDAAARGPLGLLIVAVVVGSFALLTVAQGLLPAQADGPRWRAWHAHLSNGLYLNTLANRAVLRLWPRPSSPHPRPGTRA